jgi:hypothetical protein
MGSNFVHKPRSVLLADIVTGLRLRYATLNDGIPRPMLNSPVREGTPDAELLVRRVITRLDAAHQANYLVEKLTNLSRDFWNIKDAR